MQKNSLLERMKSKLTKLLRRIDIWYGVKSAKKDKVHQLRVYLKRQVNNLMGGTNMNNDNYDKIVEELIQKINETSNWIHERQRKCKPAIIIDSRGCYVNSYGTASFIDYLKAVENKQVEIHDKQYANSISNLLNYEQVKKYTAK